MWWRGEEEWNNTNECEEKKDHRWKEQRKIEERRRRGGQWGQKQIHLRRAHRWHFWENNYVFAYRFLWFSLFFLCLISSENNCCQGIISFSSHLVKMPHSPSNKFNEVIIQYSYPEHLKTKGKTRSFFPVVNKSAGKHKYILKEEARKNEGGAESSVLHSILGRSLWLGRIPAYVHNDGEITEDTNGLIYGTFYATSQKWGKRIVPWHPPPHPPGQGLHPSTMEGHKVWQSVWMLYIFPLETRVWLHLLPSFHACIWADLPKTNEQLNYGLKRQGLTPTDAWAINPGLEKKSWPSVSTNTHSLLLPTNKDST